MAGPIGVSLQHVVQIAGLWHQLPVAVQAQIETGAVQRWEDVAPHFASTPPGGSVADLETRAQLEMLVRGYQVHRERATPARSSDLSSAQENVAALLQRRMAIRGVDEEPDHDIKRREVLSAAFVAQVSARAEQARARKMITTVEAPVLDVTRLRHDALVGLTAILTDKSQGGFLFKRNVPRERRFVYLADSLSIYKRLGFFLMDFLTADQHGIQFSFSYPIDLNKVSSLLARNPRFTVTRTDAPDSLLVQLDDAYTLRVSDYRVEVLYKPLLERPNDLMRAIHVATRVVEAIHQDKMISADYRIVRMSELRPFMDALLGRSRSSHYRELGQHVLSHIGEMGGQSRFFRETRTSLKRRQQALALRERRGDAGASQPLPPAVYNLVNFPKLPHARYQIVQQGGEGKNHDLIVGLDIVLDEKMMAQHLSDMGQRLEVEQDIETMWRVQGAKEPNNTTVWRVYQRDGDDKRLVLTFTRETVKVPMDSDGRQFMFAMQVLDVLDNGGTYQASTMDAGYLKAGLTDEEHLVWDAFNLYERFYRVVISLILERQNIDQAGYSITPKAHEWALTTMQLAAEQTPEGRYLHLLKTAIAMVRREDLRLFGETSINLFHRLEDHIEHCEGIFGRGGKLAEVFAKTERAGEIAANSTVPDQGLEGGKDPRLVSPNERQVFVNAKDINAAMKFGRSGVGIVRDRIARALKYLAIMASEEGIRQGPIRTVHTETFARFVEAAGRGLGVGIQEELARLLKDVAAKEKIELPV